MIILKEEVRIAQSSASVPTPPAGYVAIFVNSANNHLSQKDSAGTVIDLTATGGGGVTLTEVEVNMGTTPVSSKSFTITDASIDTSKKILVFPSPSVATGRAGNDWEMDTATFSALAGTGNFVLNVTSTQSMVGTRKLYYQVI